MATSQISAVIMEARAAMEKSHRLLDEMRILRLQVNQNLTAVRDSAITLATKVSATAATASADMSAVRLSPAVLAADPRALDSQVGGAAPDGNASGPSPSEPPPLDPKDQIGLDLLTPREIQVLRLIGEGQRTKEIAFSLGISFKTAVTHRSNIMEKLAIHEGPRLVRFAIRTGITTA